MNNAEKKFEKRFQESRLQYIKSLPGKISEIKIIWNQLNSSEWRIKVILKMRNMVHTLISDLQNQIPILNQTNVS